MYTRVDFIQRNQGCKPQKNDNEDREDKTVPISLSLNNNNNNNNNSATSNNKSSVRNSRSPSPSNYSSRNYSVHQSKRNTSETSKSISPMQILPPPTPPGSRSLLSGVIPPPPPLPVSSSTSTNGCKQLNKLKRFLTTLQQFASDISPEINERVKNLILNLINSAITIEDFHSRLQETTNFPLRPFVIPFLKANLPLLQRELLYLSRLSLTSSQANIYDYLIQSAGSSSSDYLNENEDDLSEDMKLNLLKRTNPSSHHQHQTNTNANNVSVNSNSKRKSPPQHDEMNSTNQKQDISSALAPPQPKRHHHHSHHSQQQPHHHHHHHNQLTANQAAFNSFNNLLPPPPPLPSPIILKSTQANIAQPIVAPSNFPLNNTNTSSVTHPQSSQTAFNQSNSSTSAQSSSSMSATSASQSIQQLVAPNPNFNHFHGYYSQAPPPPPPSSMAAGVMPHSLNYLNHSAAAFGQIKMEDLNKWRDLRERSFTNYMRDFEQSELSDENVEDELKTIDNMSNALNEMTQRSKRVISLLHKKTSKLRKQLDDYEMEFKRRNDEFKSDRRTEERIEEIKKRADEAVIEVKRQALVEMQKANEMVLREREKFDMLLKETQAIEKQNENLLENCWNCGRKASETCGGCRQAKYCSQFCQHKNWEWIHHKQCAVSKNYTKKNDSNSSILATSSSAVTTTNANCSSSSTATSETKKESLNLSIEIKPDQNENLNTSLNEKDIKASTSSNNNKSPKSFSSSRSSSSSPNSNRNQNDDE